MRREFLQLAAKYAPAKNKVAGCYISDKLDGTRCLWDGGVSRGVRTEDVPWASVVNPKTGERKPKIKPYATGLWSRYGNPIMAPGAFLDQLPRCPLDGELWAGVGSFQLCRSICAGDTPDPRFLTNIDYAVYSSPPLALLFSTGLVKNTNMRCQIDLIAVEHWLKTRMADDFAYLLLGSTFEDELRFLDKKLGCTSKCYLHLQTRLCAHEEEAKAQVEEYLQKVLDKGGEGIVLRDPRATWTPKRHNGILKYKPFSDAEGTLVGFTSGRETDKGSKHLGKIGALILDYKGKRLELSGMTDEERLFSNDAMRVWAAKNPGLDIPPDVGVAAKHFKVGDSVTFKYRELSDDGIPKEARYSRVRDEE